MRRFSLPAIGVFLILGTAWGWGSISQGPYHPLPEYHTYANTPTPTPKPTLTWTRTPTLTPTSTPTQTPTPSPTETLTPFPGCEESHLPALGQVTYDLQGCPGHRVTITYQQYSGLQRILKIRGVFGHPPYFPGNNALGFFWVFQPDPLFGDFEADLEFQYNLADMPPWESPEGIGRLYGWEEYIQIWVDLRAIHDPANSTMTIADQQEFYKWYAVGPYRCYGCANVPTLSEVAVILLAFLMGLGLMVWRRKRIWKDEAEGEVL